MRVPLLCAALGLAVSATAFERVNVSTAGEQANGEGFQSRVSADGQLVIFESRATNLVVDDFNGVGDVFLRDLVARMTDLLSEGVDGSGQTVSSNGSSVDPYLSSNNRFAAFRSNATNIVLDDFNRRSDAFVRDLTTEVVERVSVHSDGSEGNGDSLPNGISADGRFVLFKSFADNLVGNDTNETPDLFIRDRLLNTTERVNVSSTGAQGNPPAVGTPPRKLDVALQLGSGDMSSDGRFVAFPTVAPDLIAGDAAGHDDIYLRDRTLGTTKRISVSATGVPGDDDSRSVRLSDDGKFAALGSLANNLVPEDDNTFTSDVFLRNLGTGEMTLVNRTAAGTQSVNNVLQDISSDGRYVVWSTTSTNLIPGDPNTAPNLSDIFVYDHKNRAIARVTAGVEPGESSSRATISGDGSLIAFASRISTLVENDTNGLNDFFVVDNPLFEPPDITFPRPPRGLRVR